MKTEMFYETENLFSMSGQADSLCFSRQVFASYEQVVNKFNVFLENS